MARFLGTRPRFLALDRTRGGGFLALDRTSGGGRGEGKSVKLIENQRKNTQIQENQTNLEKHIFFQNLNVGWPLEGNRAEFGEIYSHFRY